MQMHAHDKSAGHEYLGTAEQDFDILYVQSHT